MWRLCVGLPATDRLIHCPRFLALDQLVKRLLTRQALVKVDRNGHVAESKRRAVVRLFAMRPSCHCRDSASSGAGKLRLSLSSRCLRPPGTGAKMRATGGLGRQSGRRRAEETKPDMYTPQKPGPEARLLCWWQARRPAISPTPRESKPPMQASSYGTSLTFPSRIVKSLSTTGAL